MIMNSIVEDNYYPSLSLDEEVDEEVEEVEEVDTDVGCATTTSGEKKRQRVKSVLSSSSW